MRNRKSGIVAVWVGIALVTSAIALGWDSKEIGWAMGFWLGAVTMACLVAWDNVSGETPVEVKGRVKK